MTQCGPGGSYGRGIPNGPRCNADLLMLADIQEHNARSAPKEGLPDVDATNDIRAVPVARRIVRRVDLRDNLGGLHDSSGELAGYRDDFLRVPRGWWCKPTARLRRRRRQGQSTLVFAQLFSCDRL